MESVHWHHVLKSLIISLSMNIKYEMGLETMAHTAMSLTSEKIVN